MPRLLLLAAASLAVVVGAVGIVRHRQSAVRFEADTAEAVELLADRLSETARLELVREPDPMRRRTLLARALFVHEMNPGWIADLPQDEAAREAARSRRRLALIQQLGLQVLAEQPASYQAEMFVGGAAFLRLVREARAAAWSARDEWEVPLHRAMQLAPGAQEPIRLLALAYLTLWDRLPEARRTEARELLRQAFRDPDTFTKLVDAWLSVAGSTEQALQLLPDTSSAWQLLATRFARQRQWSSWIEATRRARLALRAELEEQLEDARARLGAGDRVAAFSRFVQVAASTRPDRAEADLLVAALTERPPGLAGPALHDTALAWLQWAEGLALLGQETLPSTAFVRLASGLRDLSPAQRGTASLLAGDLVSAQQVARQADSRWSEDWGAYGILEARLLLARRDPDGARESLSTLHRSWRRRLPFWLVRQEVATAAGDDEEVATASAELRALALARWPATDWQWRSRRASLDLLPLEAAEGLLIELPEVPLGGSVLGIQWDGVRLPDREVAAGEHLRLDLDVTPRPHLLELEVVAGERLYPGAVALLLDRDAATVSAGLSR